MKIEKTFTAIAGYFDVWVKIMEPGTRKLEVRDSKPGTLKLLIISPPTDPGIIHLARANAKGETHLLCFNDDLAGIARTFAGKHGLKKINYCRAPFFEIPSDENYFDAIFANCFFDFCAETMFDLIIDELQRVLQKHGQLFAVYMSIPENLPGKL